MPHYWACALESRSHIAEPTCLKLLKCKHPRSMLHNKRSHHNEKTSHCNWRVAPDAAAKSLQLCPTLCDSIDGSPPGSPIPRTLQAGTLESVAISFSNAWKWKVKGKSLLSTIRQKPEEQQDLSNFHKIIFYLFSYWSTINFFQVYITWIYIWKIFGSLYQFLEGRVRLLLKWSFCPLIFCSLFFCWNTK